MSYFLLENGSRLSLENNAGALLLEPSVAPLWPKREFASFLEVDTFAGPNVTVRNTTLAMMPGSLRTLEVVSQSRLLENRYYRLLEDSTVMPIGTDTFADLHITVERKR